MSALVLVRHAQAMAFEQVSDRLSQCGAQQARHLAAYWLARGITFDEVYRGSLARHAETADFVASEYRGAGVCWPEAVVLPEFNEYDAEGILRRLGQDDWNRIPPGPERNRQFQKLFEAAMQRWAQGEPAADVESWVEFRARVQRGLRTVFDRPGSGRSVVVFTSGGPIGVAVQMALAAPDRTALDLNWRVRNCSLTEFLFSAARFTLESFNGTPHLAETTFR